jgi:hypothetical protein
MNKLEWVSLTLGTKVQMHERAEQNPTLPWAGAHQAIDILLGRGPLAETILNQAQV